MTLSEVAPLNRIEEAVRTRDMALAKMLILAYLRQERRSLESRVVASEYYRRLSLFPLALHVLGPEEDLQSVRETAHTLARARLQLSRVLNLLGASQYALRIIKTVPRQVLVENRGAAVGIFLSNYRYEESGGFFDDLLSQPVSSLTYRQRLELVSAADTVFGKGEPRQALEILNQVLRHSSEPLLVAIANQAKGSFLLLRGDFRGASEALLYADSLFRPDDLTLDRGYLDKWISALLILTGREDEARARLQRAWRILYRRGYKPEAWLEVLFWKGLSRFRRRAELPEEWARILAYPSPGNRLTTWIERYMEVPSNLILAMDGIRKKISSRSFDLHSDLALIGGKARWSMNLPERLSAYLIQAGPAGIPFFRACETLWPDELFSFRSNLKRMEQVVLRARKEVRLPIVWSELHLGPREAKNWTTCSPAFHLASRRPKPRGWEFLRQNPCFARRDVERYFGLSKRAALNICEEWLKGGWVQAKGNTRRASYCVIELGNSFSNLKTES